MAEYANLGEALKSSIEFDRLVNIEARKNQLRSQRVRREAMQLLRKINHLGPMLTGKELKGVVQTAAVLAKVRKDVEEQKEQVRGILG